MNRPSIGFYVHHDGRGHLERTRAVAEALGHDRVSVVTSHPDARTVLGGGRLTQLPGDVPSGPARALGDVSANGVFHWAPERPEVSGPRVEALLDWVRSARPAVVVVDVSVEVAVQLRLLGVPVIVVRLAGHRDDAAHRLAHQVAELLLAPFPQVLEEEATPLDVRRRSHYSGYISRHAPTPENELPTRPSRNRALVVWGRGTPAPSVAALEAAAAATPEWSWSAAGPWDPSTSGRVIHLGWQPEPRDLTAAADVVIGTAGDGTIGLIGATQSRFVALPQARPFDEQQSAAAQLHRLGLAAVHRGWPSPERWGGLLREALAIEPTRLDLLGVSGAAQRAAAAIDAVAYACALRVAPDPGLTRRAV